LVPFNQARIFVEAAQSLDEECITAVGTAFPRLEAGKTCLLPPRKVVQ